MSDHVLGPFWRFLVVFDWHKVFDTSYELALSETLLLHSFENLHLDMLKSNEKIRIINCIIVEI